MIRVFVGCAANHEDIESQAVLEWSIRKHASQPIDIVWMRQSRDPASPWHVGKAIGQGWDTRQWATPFSGFRWAIPEVCGFQGRAIYTDSDVIFMADIAGLWEQAIRPGKFLVCRGDWRICVSMFDCAEARRHIPPISAMRRDPGAHRRMCGYIKQHRELLQPFAGEWNLLDKESRHRDLADPRIKAIHYTDMRSQPQLRHAIPRLRAAGRAHWYDGKGARAIDLDQFPRINALFDELLAEAAANGYGPERYMDGEPFGAYRIRSKAA